MLTPEDVLQRRFDEVNLRSGYDPDEVDDFLDTAAQALRAHASRGASEALLTADRVLLIRFTATHFRRGYEPAQVDALLAELAEALRAHEARTAGGSAAS